MGRIPQRHKGTLAAARTYAQHWSAAAAGVLTECSSAPPQFGLSALNGAPRPCTFALLHAVPCLLRTQLRPQLGNKCAVRWLWREKPRLAAAGTGDRCRLHESLPAAAHSPHLRWQEMAESDGRERWPTAMANGDGRERWRVRRSVRSVVAQRRRAPHEAGVKRTLLCAHVSSRVHALSESVCATVRAHSPAPSILRGHGPRGSSAAASPAKPQRHTHPAHSRTLACTLAGSQRDVAGRSRGGRGEPRRRRPLTGRQG